MIKCNKTFEEIFPDKYRYFMIKIFNTEYDVEEFFVCDMEREGDTKEIKYIYEHNMLTICEDRVLLIRPMVNDGNTFRITFCRETDMIEDNPMPKLLNGMFVEDNDACLDFNGKRVRNLGVVVNNKIVFRQGYSIPVDYYNEFGVPKIMAGKIIRVWEKARSFDDCKENNCDWSVE